MACAATRRSPTCRRRPNSPSCSSTTSGSKVRSRLPWRRGCAPSSSPASAPRPGPPRRASPQESPLRHVPLARSLRPELHADVLSGRAGAWIGRAPETTAPGHGCRPSASRGRSRTPSCRSGDASACAVSSRPVLRLSPMRPTTSTSSPRMTAARHRAVPRDRAPPRCIRGCAGPACAAAAKPVVCLKVGRSDAAARAALSHTGALVGSVRAFSALLRRYGVIEVEDFPSSSRRSRSSAAAAGRAAHGLRRSRSPAASARFSQTKQRLQDSVEPLSGDARRRAPGGVPQLPRPRQPAGCLGGSGRERRISALARADGRLGSVRRAPRARRPVAVPRRDERRLVRADAPGFGPARGGARCVCSGDHGAQRRPAAPLSGARL